MMKKINFPRVLWLNSLDPACYLSPLRIWSTHGSWLAPTSSKTHVIFSEYNSLTCNTIILPLCNVQCKNLWYELNPRVRCAFGNVFNASQMLIWYSHTNVWVPKASVRKRDTVRIFSLVLFLPKNLDSDSWGRNLTESELRWMGV